MKDEDEVLGESYNPIYDPIPRTPSNPAGASGGHAMNAIARKKE